ncbi:MAG: M20/M25/M40 family metallo-hydrolase, partial [Acidobacteriota bacterium]
PLFAPVLSGTGQEKPDGQKAREHVRYLAADEFRGRRSGTPEYRRAAEYVAAKMKEYGLQPGGDSGTWFQEVPLKDWRYIEPPVRLELVSPVRRIYHAGRNRDFGPVSGTGSGTVKGNLAFAGYGVVSEKMPWNDYEGVNVKGKIVLVLPDVPAAMDSEEKKEWSLDKKIQTAAERGAVGLIELDLSSPGQTGLTPPGRPASIQKKETCPPGFVVLRANRNFIDDVFYSTGKSWRYPVSLLLREKKPQPLELDAVVEMEAHSTWEDRQAPNVIGILPGRDRKLKEEVVVIGGHLDHLGVGVDGYVYPGADDNAASVGTILELARVLQANKFRPKRTVVFAAWAGEELGLRGANYYVEHPVRRLEKTALYINIDMVGTGDSDLWVGGMWEYADLYDIIKEALDPEMKEKLNSRMNYRGSDHTAFMRKGVPWISLRTGNPLTEGLDDEHPEYHHPGDLPEYIQPELLELAANYHYKILTYVANTPQKLLDPRHRIQALHRDAVVADMHCDAIGRYIAGEDLTKDNPKGHIDIPKLKRGAVDLEVFACFVPPPQSEVEKHQAARKIFDQVEHVHRLVEENPKDLALVLEPNDVAAVRNTGKTGVLIGIEGGYALENDLNLLRSFHRSGVRLLTLTHWTRTDWADASGDEPAELGGLTEFGEKVIQEMNRLGMVIDVSHAHDETFADVLNVSKAPVVASHSCCRALADHHRNLSDDMLKALAKNNGVVGVNFMPGFLSAEVSRRQKALWAEIAAKYGLPQDRNRLKDANPELREKATSEFRSKWAEAQKTLEPATVKTLVDHIAHVIEVTGSADHVGLGSDFDGISTTPVGLENIGLLPAITEELTARGYKNADIRKILGDNFLRVFNSVRKIAKDIQSGGKESGRDE